MLIGCTSDRRPGDIRGGGVPLPFLKIFVFQKELICKMVHSFVPFPNQTFPIFQPNLITTVTAQRTISADCLFIVKVKLSVVVRN